jgi:hypothetical protein
MTSLKHLSLKQRTRQQARLETLRTTTMEAMTSSYVDDKLGKMAYDAFMMQQGVSDPPWNGLNRYAQEAWITSARTIEAFTEGRIRDDQYDEYRRSA